MGSLIVIPNRINQKTDENLFINPISVTNSLSSKIKVLYLYNSSDAYYRYDSYEALFESSEEIVLNGINASDFAKDATIASDYHVLIVGVSAFGWWNNPNASLANMIVGTNLPVLALGYGGGTFFQSLGLGYGGGSMGFTCGGLNVNSTDASHDVFSEKYTFSVPGDITLNGSYNKHVSGIYMGNTFSNTEYLARGVNNQNHAPFAEYSGFTQKMLYLGFIYAPSYLSTIHMLVHNCIEYLAGPPSQISVDITSPANYSIITSTNTTIDIGFSFTGDFDCVQAELYVNEAPFSTPVTFLLGSSSGSGVFSNVDLSSAVLWEDGWYKLSVVVTDNKSWIGHESIYINRNEYDGPYLDLLTPANNSEVEGNTTFDLEVNSDFLDFLDYYVDGVNQSRLLYQDGSYSIVVTFEVNVSTWGVGQHELKFIADGHPNDTTTLIILLNVTETTATTTSAIPTDTSTTEPESSTTESDSTTTDIDSSTTADSTTRESSTNPNTGTNTSRTSSTEDSSSQSVITLNATPGFTTAVILTALLLLIPIYRVRKRS